jgi:hypothetical protein
MAFKASGAPKGTLPHLPHLISPLKAFKRVDLKELKAIVKIMRNEGVLSLKTADIDLQLSPEALFPVKKAVEAVSEEAAADPYADFPAGMLTPEQLAFYSAGGDPSDDPENQNN